MKGFVDLPFQIIITSELDGGEYAAYRAISDKAKRADVERLIKAAKSENDDVLMDHYGVLLDLVVKKNPQFFELVKGGIAMKEMLLEMVQDRVDEMMDRRERETTVSHLKDIMDSFGVTIEKAMDSLKIPMAQRSTYAGLLGQGL